MDGITYSSIFTGEKPTFEVSRVIKKASRNSLSTSKAETPKTPGGVNGRNTPVKGTPKRGASNNATANPKSAAKSPKLDAESLTQEFMKYEVLFIAVFEHVVIYYLFCCASRIREERESLRHLADRRKQQKLDEKKLANEKKKEEKRAMAEYVKVLHKFEMESCGWFTWNCLLYLLL